MLCIIYCSIFVSKPSECLQIFCHSRNRYSIFSIFVKDLATHEKAAQIYEIERT